jgi:Putative zinc-finger
MTACDDKLRLLVRLSDEAAADTLTAGERAGIESHLAACGSCRAALDDQRVVAEILRARPPLEPSRAFAVRLASRLDEVSGWLGILDWQAWTFRLAPVALALVVAAFFTATSSRSDGSDATIEAWTRGVAEPASVASVVWQDGTTADLLLETVLTGSAAAERENGIVR